MYRTASGNVLPYANVKNTGLFCVKDYCNHGHTGSYTLVTPKGKLYFAQLREMILLVSYAKRSCPDRRGKKKTVAGQVASCAHNGFSGYCGGFE